MVAIPASKEKFTFMHCNVGFSNIQGLKGELL